MTYQICSNSNKKVVAFPKKEEDNNYTLIETDNLELGEMKMARINKTGETDLYKNFDKVKRQKNDCSIIAVSVVCNLPYEESAKLLKEKGKKDNLGAETKIILEVVQEAGFFAEKVSPRKFLDRYQGIHQAAKYVTTHHPERFGYIWKDGETYLFFCKKHVAAIVNGENNDWTKGRSKRALQIYKITEKQDLVQSSEVKSVIKLTKEEVGKPANDKIRVGDLVAVKITESARQFTLCYVEGGSFWVDGRLSNAWTLRAVNKDGSLSKAFPYMYKDINAYLGEKKVKVSII